MSSAPRRTGAFALAAVLFAACSSVSASHRAAPPTSTAAPTTSPTPAAFPVTIASAQGPVTIRTRPTAIVSLSPTATEDLYGVGAGPQVIAVDAQSNYPADAPRTTLSGFTLNVEAIAAKRPDLVVIADDSTGLSKALAKLAIPTIVDNPATTLEGAYAQITQLGVATGHGAEATALVASMRSAIATAVAATPPRTRPVRIYHEVDQTFYSATSSTFIGQLYKMLGAQDIADAADSQGSGYPQLSAEYIVKADPDIIFLADGLCCGQTRATVSARPGWSAIAAVKHGDVVALNDDVASRWGPRVVDLVRAIAAGLMLAPASGP